jgi:hypothetical protein
MYAHEYVHYELEFDLNNPHVLIEEEDWKLISKVERSLLTFQNFLEQQEDIFEIVSKFSSLNKQKTYNASKYWSQNHLRCLF